MQKLQGRYGARRGGNPKRQHSLYLHLQEWLGTIRRFRAGDESVRFTIQSELEIINEIGRGLNEIVSQEKWRRTELSRLSRLVRTQRSAGDVARVVISELTPLMKAQLGAFFSVISEEHPFKLERLGTYGFGIEENGTADGHGSAGQSSLGLLRQCVLEKKIIHLKDVPSHYSRVRSGLGVGLPAEILILPVLHGGRVKAVVELATLAAFSETQIGFIEQFLDGVGTALGSFRELEEKAEQLELNSKYKSEFLANMSHELRTPLNSLLILSKILSENRAGNLTPEQVKFAGTIHSAGCDLLALINEILDLSKIESGRMSVEIEEVPMEEIRDHLERTFRPVAENKGLRFSIDVSAPVPGKISTDRNRLQQILKNLLSNAIKFTDRGEVTLKIGASTENGALSFEVTDTGIGIAKDKQRMIFEAFQQADGTTSRKYGGTGLGLAISREIARLLGGVIEVESEKGQGSRFTLFLPLTEPVASTVTAPLAVAPAPFEKPSLAVFKGRRILMADDDLRNAFAITSVLESHGMVVLHAENGKQALQILEKEPVDLVIMDTIMPDMDGLEATTRIRQWPGFGKLPIISLTAKAMKGDMDNALAAGASDYITKPVDPDQFLSLLQSWLDRAPVHQGA